MVRQIKLKYLLLLFTIILVSSCEYGRKAEEQLSKFNSHAEDFDIRVKEGIEKANLDSLLPETSKKLKEADSIIKNASSTIDSLNQKMNDIENIFN